MEAAFRSAILDSAAVVSLVDDRVSWGYRNRSDALPAIVLHRIYNEPDYCHDGPSGLEHAIIQADCFADTYTVAINTKKSLISALSGLRGSYEGVLFQGIFVQGERDLSDEGSAADEVIFRISVDFQVWYGS